MNKLEILGKLTGLVKSGISKAVIEREAGLPKNSLSSVLTGVKEMPNKWVEKFGGYFEKLEVKESGGNVQTAVNTLLNIGALQPAFDVEKINARIKQLEWVAKVEVWCEKRGWKAEQLIEKFDELERRLGETIANSSHLTTTFDLTPLQIKEKYGEEVYEMALKFIGGQNKPNTAPQIEKSGESTPKEKESKEGAEKKPEKLSPFMQARQALKNGQK